MEVKTQSESTTKSSEKEILKAATNVQAVIDADQKQSKLDTAMETGALPGAEPPAAEAAQGELLVMKETLFFVVKTSVAKLQEKWQWSDPGDEWKRHVGDLLAQLADKYLGSWVSSSGVETSLLIIVLPWVLENAISKGLIPFPGASSESTETPDAASTSSARGDGIREVHKSERAA